MLVLAASSPRREKKWVMWKEKKLERTDSITYPWRPLCSKRFSATPARTQRQEKENREAEEKEARAQRGHRPHYRSTVDRGEGKEVA